LTQPARYLTKSLFKTGFECPAKLRYAKDPAYGNNQEDNTFLQVLAEGGFQVGELAKLMFAGGVEVSELAHGKALSQTAELITQNDVTVFEAALTECGFDTKGNTGINNTPDARYFVRVDVLRKHGNIIDIIEVKSKSFDPDDERFFKNTRGFNSKTLPYLLDVAFQTHVARLAMPALTIRSFLLLPNKAKAATVDGLNQMFPIKQVEGNKRRVTCEPLPGLTDNDVGEPLLELIDVTDLVAELLQQVFDIPGMTGTIEQLGEQLHTVLLNPRHLRAPVQSQCKSCEYRLPPGHAKRSGFHDCWKETVDNARLDAGEPLVVDLWDGRRTKAWMSAGKRFMADLSADDLPLAKESDKLSRTHRQWLQISGDQLNERGYGFDKDLFAREMDSWQWPINLIDFETSRTALPFHHGGKPYGLVAFQWSHHVLHEDGRLEHADDFLMTEPGQLPNVAFLKSLRHTLGRNDGTVMMWSPYENSVLNALLETLASEMALAGIVEHEREALYGELLEFVDSLTIRKQGNTILHKGNRAMVDLCDLSSDGFFHQRAGGSNSIKKVLPAMLTASDFLRDLYSQPVYGSVDQESVTAHAFNSRHFNTPMTWWQLDETGDVTDPYQLLPPVFADVDIHESDDDAVINQGGAAAAAYGRLQLEQASDATAQAWRNALLKYCELDTLAMAMIVQGWRAWLR
jgi:hypothetical protein